MDTGDGEVLAVTYSRVSSFIWTGSFQKFFYSFHSFYVQELLSYNHSHIQDPKLQVRLSGNILIFSSHSFSTITWIVLSIFFLRVVMVKWQIHSEISPVVCIFPHFKATKQRWCTHDILRSRERERERERGGGGARSLRSSRGMMHDKTCSFCDRVGLLWHAWLNLIAWSCTQPTTMHEVLSSGLISLSVTTLWMCTTL